LTRIGWVYAQKILSAIDDRLSAFALTVGALEWDAALRLGRIWVSLSRLRSASQSLWEWQWALASAYHRLLRQDTIAGACVIY